MTKVGVTHCFRGLMLAVPVVNVWPTHCRPWMKDRFMAPDIEAAHRLLVEQKASAGFWQVGVAWP